jgi:hypothetical protein
MKPLFFGSIVVLALSACALALLVVARSAEVQP